MADNETQFGIYTSPRIAVVIPCYKCKSHIDSVLSKVGPEVDVIYAIDDKCPENTGAHVEKLNDGRVKVIYHPKNLGVGGAVMSGYRAALADHCDIVIKIDGDDQMDPSLIGHFIAPILIGAADYTKGNRFYRIENLRGMPLIRLFGNLALSFVTKMSTGYWGLLDPTNGYTAINKSALQRLEMDKISLRYFFESDMLFRLGLIRAKVKDIPMYAKYGSEVSNLRIKKIALEFAYKHLRNSIKRIFYQYILLDFNIASLELLAGLTFFSFGVVNGIWQWVQSYNSGTQSPVGSVVLPALLVILGAQFILGFLHYDTSNEPSESLSAEDALLRDLER